MKTEIKENKQVKEKPFPKLMKLKGSDTIILMSHPKTGVVINAGKHYHIIGNYSDMWDMDCFEDFNGSIALSNE